MSDVRRRLRRLEEARRKGSGETVIILMRGNGEILSEEETRRIEEAERGGRSVIKILLTGNIDPARL